MRIHGSLPLINPLAVVHCPGGNDRCNSIMLIQVSLSLINLLNLSNPCKDFQILPNTDDQWSDVLLLSFVFILIYLNIF